MLPEQAGMPVQQPSKFPKWVIPAAAGLAAVTLLAVFLARRRPAAPPPPTQGAIAFEVRTNPPGAAIRVNNEAKGNSNLKLELAPGAYQIEAQLEGYQPAVTSVTLAPGQESPADMILQPLPQMLRLFTDLEAGKVALDEQPAAELQEGQLVLENIAAGPHKLRISSRYGEAAILFETKPGAAPSVTGPVSTKELFAVLVSNLGGRGRVVSSAASAKVKLDGQPAGDAGPQGLELNNVAPGDHELIVGEGKDERKMVVNFGPNPALTAFLKSDRNVGALVVVTGEDGVRVLLNDKPISRQTRRGQLRISNLDVNDYGVRVIKDGFQNEPEQRVAIRKGEDSKLEFKLRPIPTVASLAIRGAVPGTEVIFDRRSLGTVDADGTLSASNLVPGEHILELRKEQHRTKTIRRNFNAGEAVTLTGGDVVLERALATLRVNVNPAGATVLVGRPGETPRQAPDTTLTLVEGSYTITARAPGHAERSVTVQIAAGETRSVDITLPREKSAVAAAVTKGAMNDFEDIASWSRDGNWFVRRGGNFVSYRSNPPGSFLFTAMLRRGRRLQWVASRSDDRNYLLFQLDKKNYYRNQVVNGRSSELLKVPHKMDNQDYYTLQVDILANGIVHKIHDGEQWNVLDDWREAGKGVLGKFGFLIPGGDTIAVSNFSFQAQ